MITLLTDFGLQDEYVGVMKGVIAGISPGERVLDISHQIDPQDIVHGAFVLEAAYTYFPVGSIHVAVVDPGVGSERRIIAAACGGHLFVAPDNGILEGILGDGTVSEAVHVSDARYFLEKVSHTFHGRDIFAPVAAHLANGVPLSNLGSAVDLSSLVSGVVPRCRFLSEICLEGAVVAVDHFGNLMTNIPNSAIERLAGPAIQDRMVVELNETPIGRLVKTYSQVAAGASLAIIGSRRLLEISVSGGKAHHVLKAGKGSRVRVYMT
jgi:S-adenosylmethionine hydrolase